MKHATLFEKENSYAPAVSDFTTSPTANTIDPTGLISNSGLSMLNKGIAPDTAEPSTWPNACFRNVITNEGNGNYLLQAQWLGSHPQPIGNSAPSVNEVHYQSTPLTTGQYLGCASVPGAGLVAWYAGATLGGPPVWAIVAAASVVAYMSEYDNVNQCANSFAAFMTNLSNPANGPDWLSGGADDMSSMINGIMRAGPSSGVGSLLNYQMIDDTNPGAANGPNGGSNNGAYYDASGADQYGYGGTGSLLQASYNDLNADVVHSLANGSTSLGSFTLNANANA